VEPSDTHRLVLLLSEVMGIASLHPSYYGTG